MGRGLLRLLERGFLIVRYQPLAVLAYGYRRRNCHFGQFLPVAGYILGNGVVHTCNSGRQLTNVRVRKTEASYLAAMVLEVRHYRLDAPQNAAAGDDVND